MNNFSKLYGGSMVSVLASQQETPGFDLDLSLWSLRVSPRTCMGFLQGLRFPPSTNNMHDRSIFQQGIPTIFLYICCIMANKDL